MQLQFYIHCCILQLFTQKGQIMDFYEEVLWTSKSDKEKQKFVTHAVSFFVLEFIRGDA